MNGNMPCCIVDLTESACEQLYLFPASIAAMVASSIASSRLVNGLKMLRVMRERYGSCIVDLIESACEQIHFNCFSRTVEVAFVDLESACEQVEIADLSHRPAVALSISSIGLPPPPTTLLRYSSELSASQTDICVGVFRGRGEPLRR